MTSVCPYGWTWSLRWTLIPRGNIHSPGGYHSILFRKNGANKGSSSLGENFTPRGQSLALGANFTPRVLSLALGANFTPKVLSLALGANFTPRGLSLALGANFTPEGHISPLRDKTDITYILTKYSRNSL
jgi:hypothetical protein